ncbi:hypothetical protein [Jeotgalicoccus meleagridis]|uniref:Uncharacterized protein n=1 Tax=Jeotgalicoccus meleagridis TaxID=2759181 RepID=A0A6V7R3J7_9STAP|nr:hypothetical protein [Jeotgalicoccus meleagridis]CAD2071502.1 hypothetical protein JEODO184_00273 [Jeotgalicoccus meleagridis]
MWLSHKDNQYNGKIFEVAAGRVAENFVGSNKGYWDKNLTVEKLFENEEVILDQDGYKSLENTVELSKWMTEDNTGW